MNNKNMLRLSELGIDAEQYMRIMDRPISYHRVFADVTGSVAAAVFLSQAQYWQLRVPSQDKDGKPRDGFFYKSIQDWEEETRLNYKEQSAARKILRKKGILLEVRRGIPARLYFKINFDALIRECLMTGKRSSNFDESSVVRDKKGKFSRFSADRETGFPQIEQQVSRPEDNKSSSDRPTISESTTKSIKDHHKTGAAAPVVGSQRNALESQSQNPAPAGAEIAWPASIHAGMRPAMLKKMAGLEAEQQQQVVDILAARLASPGEPLRDPLAYCASLARRAAGGDLEVPVAQPDPSVERDKQRARRMEKELAADAAALESAERAERAAAELVAALGEDEVLKRARKLLPASIRAALNNPSQAAQLLIA